MFCYNRDVCCLEDALESMVVGLVGDPELHGATGAISLAAREAVGLNGVGALLEFQISAHGLRGLGAVGIGAHLTRAAVPGHIHLGKHGHGVGLDGQVGAHILGHLDRGGHILQLAVLKGHVPAVLVAVPHLLAGGVDDPLGVALLLGHLLAHRLLVVLGQGVEPLLLAHNPRVFDGYGKAYKIGDYAMIIFKKGNPIFFVKEL